MIALPARGRAHEEASIERANAAPSAAWRMLAEQGVRRMREQDES